MINVCIVEDTKDIRETIESFVNEAPDMCCLATYDNAEEARTGLLLKKPDVVIMDIGLPVMNGIECMMNVKSTLKNTKFLMFTIFENDENVFEALKVGAHGYILKREHPERIIDYIREIFDGGAPMSRVIAAKVLQSFRSTPAKSQVENLSPRQKEILQYLAEGNSYAWIATKLSLAPGTIKQHCHKIYQKLHVNNKVQAINKYRGQ